MALSGGEGGVTGTKAGKVDSRALTKPVKKRTDKPKQCEAEQPASSFTLKETLWSIFKPVIPAFVVRDIFQCLTDPAKCKWTQPAKKACTDSDRKEASVLKPRKKISSGGKREVSWTLAEISQLPSKDILSALELLNIGTPDAINRVDDLMKKCLYS